MKSHLIFLLLIFLLAVPVSAAEWASVSVTDDYDFTSIITSEPKRIVSLSPTTTEILFSLGLGDKVVGVTEYCNYPAEAKEKTIIGGYSTINVERIVALDPDLIFGNIGNGLDNIEHLRKLGETVICIDPDSVEGTYRAIHLTGTATGTTAEAEELVSSMQKRVAAVTEKIAGSETPSPKVTHIMSPDPFWVSGSDTFQDELIQLAGGKNAFPEVNGWSIVSLEKLLLADPEIILVDSGAGMGDKGENILKQQIMTEPRLQSITAVKNGQVYVMDSDTFDRGGPRIVDALEDLAKITHPDVFGDPVEHTGTEKASGFGFAAVFAAAGCLLFFRR